MSRLGDKRKEISKHKVSIGDGPRSCGRLFLDSGAFGLSRRYGYAAAKKGLTDAFAWYGRDGKLTRRFRRYLDAYAEFVREYAGGLDLYASVDVIRNPELSWLSFRYLKDKGINPLPVVHLGPEVQEVTRRYVEAGEKYVGVGGIGRGFSQKEYLRFADDLFQMLCPPPTYLPVIKTHAFAVTALPLMTRYPWYSVDSSRWAKAAGYGSILVPNKVDGRWSFDAHHKDRKPYLVCMSHRPKSFERSGPHFASLTPGEQAVILEWLDEIGVPLGDPKYRGSKKKRPEYGVFTYYNARAKANLLFFERLAATRPKWPWPFTRFVAGGLYQ